MPLSQPAGGTLADLSRLFRDGSFTGLSEGQILERFVTTRDEGAFEALLTLHGPLVLGVCRRVLDDPSDVEDAFQATFLILVKKAALVRDRGRLANWLYGVALRVSKRARGNRARRLARETSRTIDASPPETGDDPHGELRSIVDEEIARLPERFRTPVLLCYVEGLTHDEAASRMSCPVGTVRSRLAKARDVLRGRLTRRGVAPASAVAVAERAIVSPEVPIALVQSTLRAAVLLANGEELAAGVVSTSAVGLFQGALKTMAIKKFVAWVLVVGTLGAVTGSAGLAASWSQGDEPEKKADDPIAVVRKELAEAKKRNEADASRIDALEKEVKRLREFLEAPIVANPPGAQTKAEPKPLTANADSAAARSKSKDGAKPPTGKGAKPKGRLGYFEGSKGTIVTTSPTQDEVVVHDIATKKSYVYKAAEGETITPISSRDVLGINVKGETITRLAAYSYSQKAWSTIDLIEPVKNTVSPACGDFTVFYNQGGHYFYAYSSKAGRWDVLTLDKGLGTNEILHVQFQGDSGYLVGSTLHYFSVASGTWKTIELGDGN